MSKKKAFDLEENDELISIFVTSVKTDEFVKVKESFKTSFRRKPESSEFDMFWMPDQVRHDELGTFCEGIKTAKKTS